MFATSSARRFRVAAITAATSACLILGRAEMGTAQEDRERRIVTQDAQECPTGSVWRGDLGIEGLECNCSFSVTRSGEMEWHFRSEPVIRGVREGGVADGKLRAGDVITGIDDVLITTSEGGRRFANVRPGQRVTLMVRRNERIARVHVVAGSRCEALPALVPGEPFVPAEPAEPLELEVAEPVPAPEPVEGVAVDVEPLPGPELVPGVPLRHAWPAGWFGFGISCSCSVRAGAAGAPPVWRFHEPPEVYSVESGSPAESAGLRRGDVVLEIDGVPLTSDEGGARFGTVRAGQTVTFKYRRGGRTDEVTMTALERLVTGEVPLPDEEAAAELVSQMREVQARQQALMQALRGAELQGALRERELAEELAAMAETQEDARRYLEAMLQERQRARERERAREPRPDRPSPEQLRWVGEVGDVNVEVRGSSSVVTTIIEEGREILIVTRDAQIRIRLKD